MKRNRLAGETMNAPIHFRVQRREVRLLLGLRPLPADRALFLADEPGG